MIVARDPIRNQETARRNQSTRAAEAPSKAVANGETHWKKSIVSLSLTTIIAPALPGSALYCACGMAGVRAILQRARLARRDKSGTVPWLAELGLLRPVERARRFAAASSSQSLHALSLAPALLYRCQCGRTGAVAHCSGKHGVSQTAANPRQPLPEGGDVVACAVDALMKGSGLRQARPEARRRNLISCRF